MKVSIDAYALAKTLTLKKLDQIRLRPDQEHYKVVFNEWEEFYLELITKHRQII